MNTDQCWELLNSRPQWIERCRSIAGINPDPDFGALRLRDYALGTVATTLEAEGDYTADEKLADHQIDWHSLYARFRRDHPYQDVLGP